MCCIKCTEHGAHPPCGVGPPTFLYLPRSSASPSLLQLPQQLCTLPAVLTPGSSTLPITCRGLSHHQDPRVIPQETGSHSVQGTGLALRLPRREVALASPCELTELTWPWIASSC